ncbi:MAG: hypothetical protein Q8O14_11745 [bacterium]|nr:hypothetical protein [bacterium]
MKIMHNCWFPSRLPLGLRLGLASLLFIVGTSWIADEVREMVFRGESHQLWALTSAVVMMALGASCLLALAEEMIPVRSLGRSATVQPHKAMIALLSVPKNPEKLEKLIQEDNDLDAAIDSMTGDSWQQLFRGLRLHKDSLSWLTLVTSRNGSDQHTELARRIIKRLLPQCRVGEDTVDDFEDIEASMSALQRQLKLLHEEGFASKDIILDATGGMKPTSIAVALATLMDKELQFQYVSNKGSLCSYNVVAATRNNLSGL